MNYPKLFFPPKFKYILITNTIDYEHCKVNCGYKKGYNQWSKIHWPLLAGEWYKISTITSYFYLSLKLEPNQPNREWVKRKAHLELASCASHGSLQDVSFGQRVISLPLTMFNEKAIYIPSEKEVMEYLLGRTWQTEPPPSRWDQVLEDED